jgi:hypothetical protein
LLSGQTKANPEWIWPVTNSWLHYIYIASHRNMHSYDSVISIHILLFVQSVRVELHAIYTTHSTPCMLGGKCTNLARVILLIWTCKYVTASVASSWTRRLYRWLDHGTVNGYHIVLVLISSSLAVWGNCPRWEASEDPRPHFRYRQPSCAIAADQQPPSLLEQH